MEQRFWFFCVGLTASLKERGTSSWECSLRQAKILTCSMNVTTHSDCSFHVSTSWELKRMVYPHRSWSPDSSRQAFNCSRLSDLCYIAAVVSAFRTKNIDYTSPKIRRLFNLGFPLLFVFNAAEVVMGIGGKRYPGCSVRTVPLVAPKSTALCWLKGVAFSEHKFAGYNLFTSSKLSVWPICDEEGK